MEYKDAAMEFKADATVAGKFTAYGAVFGNVDDGGDTIEKGAFKKFRTKKNGKVRIPLHHDMSRVVGEADVIQDNKGLKVVGQLNMALSYAQDAYELMKDGTLDAMSVGFNILKNGSDVEWLEESPWRLRTITKAELWEVSIVPFGMNRKAKITNIKSGGELPPLRVFENFLHEKGFSIRESQVIIANGYKSLLSDSTNDGLSDSDMATLKKAITDNPINF